MGLATDHTTTEGGGPDLRLPDHRQETRSAPGIVRVLGAAAGAIGVSIVALLYLVGSPFVAVATGIVQIVMEIRDNAVRPRPFVGARHGLPFLDPPPPAPAPATQAEADDTES